MSSSVAVPLKVLFIGGTGLIGFQVIKQGLLSPKYAARFQVTVASRPVTLKSEDAAKKSKLDELKAIGAELTELDVDNVTHSAMVAEIKKHDILMILSRGISVDKTLALIAAAKEAGNLKLFLPSEHGFNYDQTVPPPQLQHIPEGKLKIAHALATAGVPYARIITGVYYEYFFGMFGGMDLAKNSITMPGAQSTRITLMSEADAAQLTAEVLLNYSAAYVRNQVVLLGVETVSWAGVAALLEKKTGSEWTKQVKTVEELEKFISENPAAAFMACFHLLMAREKGIFWNVADEKSFLQQHHKVHPEFKPKLQSVAEYVQQLKL